MITTKKVKETVETADIQVSRVKMYGDLNPWWEVKLEYQAISSNDIKGISEELNGALIIIHYGRFGLLMCIHPYYKNY